VRRRRNPDDPALLARVKLKITKSRSRVDVRAYDGAQMVGGAMFVRAPWTAQRHEKNVLESLSTEVSKPYQRKGLASLIYRTLTAQGFTIHPSSSQTWQGQQLWEGGRWPGKREVYQKRYPSTWKEKVATLRDNPDDAVLLGRLKGRVRQQLKRKDGSVWCSVSAVDGREEVAHLTLTIRGGAGRANGVWVADALRRRGVASWLYDWASRKLGVAIAHSEHQTADGAAFTRGRRRNPDDQDLLRRLTVETDDDPRWARGKVDHYLEFRAFDGKLQAATANFRVRRKYLEAAEVIVNPAWRRRGLASWLYRYAERATGMKVKHSKDQTTDGKAFAKGRRRNPSPGILVSASRGAFSAEAGGCVLEGRYGRPSEVVAADDVHDTIPHALERLVLASRAPRVAYVTKVVCYESSQGQGTGTRLMAAALEKLRGMGIGTVFLNATPLESRAMMPALLRFYVRLGFREVAAAHDRSWVGMERVAGSGKASASGRRRNPGDPKALEDALVKKLGADGDSSVMRAWILTDGRIVDLDERDELGERDVRDEHGRVDELFPLAGYDEIRGVDDLVDVHRTFMRLTGAIRLADGERSSMIHLLTVPTPAQVTACGQIAATHRNMEQDGIEIYWEPADRFVEVRPISAGKVRRILEALPGEPKTRANPRRNPPADLDSSEVIGGECGVWALAAASGRSVPEIRRAYLAAGVDIWGEGGEATGTKMHQMRRVIRHLGLDDRIVSVGFDAIHRGPRASMAMAVKNRFVSGSDGETFPVPNQEMSTVLDHATVGQIVAKARKSGLAAIAITGEITSKIRRGGGQRWREIGGTMHAIGYSPSQGVFDSALPNLGVINDPDYKALLGDTKPTGWHWHAHGDVVPKPARKALFWLFLRPVDPRA
jgi:GNAT superfamily N-acetyltransferase